MLSSMIKEHQTRQQLRKEEQERRRKEALKASTALTSGLVDHLNVAVAQAYLNQRRLDAEARRLEQSAVALQRHTQRWIALVDGFCSALKTLGDVTSWTAAMHKDVTEVTLTLQHAYSTSYGTLHTGGPHNPRHSAPGSSLMLGAPSSTAPLPTTPEHSASLSTSTREPQASTSAREPPPVSSKSQSKSAKPQSVSVEPRSGAKSALKSGASSRSAEEEEESVPAEPSAEEGVRS